MLNKNTIVKITNRDNGSVSYRIPDMSISRHFSAGETKEVTVEEVLKLSYITGGRYIIENCLLIDNEELVKQIFQNNGVEPEYYYTEEDVKELLLNGSLDELLDCLDFAPQGVIDLVKDIAVKIELNDIKKRDAIQEKTGLNITSAISINKESERDDSKPVVQRRVTDKKETAETAEEAPVRRTATKSKYTIKN